MMKRTVYFGLSTLAIAIMLNGCSDNRTLTYQANIKPILDTHCVSCHVPGGIGYEKIGLRLDSYDAIMNSTRFGPIVQPGSSISSVLYRLLSGKLDPSIRMPHGQAKLSEENVAMIGAWIDQGAKY